MMDVPLTDRPPGHCLRHSGTLGTVMGMSKLACMTGASWYRTSYRTSCSPSAERYRNSPIFRLGSLH